MGKLLGYIKAKFVSEGTVIDDNKKNQWLVGRLLGEGGFGAIYAASGLPSKSFDKVIKIEPSKNGPLYTEVNFYMRVCAEKEITNWMTDKKLKFLGIPRFISAGIQADSDNRFLIMDRYGDDLHKILMTTNLSSKCLLQIAINIIDVLKYIHSKYYSHADIKALNILQGYQSKKEIYLLDFGMVTKFIKNGDHQPEKCDPKIKHNGTLEFCPRDSHLGLVSCRRSDIESLMYNIIFWLTWDREKGSLSERVGYGNLPWLTLMKNIGNKTPSPALLKKVAESKDKYMANPELFIEEVGLSSHSWSPRLVNILTHVSKLAYSEEPNYEYIQKEFVSIICELDNKPLSSSNNLDVFRHIQWGSAAPPKKNDRKSNMCTQTADTRNNLKRPSSESDKSSQEKPAKKRKDQKTKRVLEINNSLSTVDEFISKVNAAKPKVQKRSSKTNGKSKENKSDAWKERDRSESGKPENEIIPGILIPKFAFSKLNKVPGKKVLKAFSPKENAKEKSASSSKPTKEKVETSTSPSVKDITNYDDIIPGMKALNQLKEQGPPTRFSPRIAAQKRYQKYIITHSVSCQTSSPFS